MSEHLSPEALELWANGSADSSEERHHLDICLECAQTLKESKEYFAAINSLRPRKAPPGFALRLRARLDAPSRWKKLGAALFLPLRFKIPLQLAGAALIALLLFVLPARFGKPEPMHLAQAESPAAAPSSGPEKEGLSPSTPRDMEPTTLGKGAGKKESKARLTSPEPPRPPIPEDLTMADEKDVARPSMEKLKRSKPAPILDEPVAIIDLPSPKAPMEENRFAAKSRAAAGSSKAEEPMAARKRAESRPMETEPESEPAIPSQADRASEGIAMADKAALSAGASAAPAAPSIMLSLRQDSLIRASGFRLEIQGGVVFYELKTSRAIGDSLAIRLMSLGLGGRTSVLIPSGSPDSVIIKVR